MLHIKRNVELTAEVICAFYEVLKTQDLIDTFCLYKHSSWICLQRIKVMANPIRLT